MIAPSGIGSVSGQVMTLVDRYVREQVGLVDVGDFLARHTTWLMTATPDSATELAAQIELSLAEMASGHCDESELRDDIREFIGAQQTIRLEADASQITESSADATLEGVLDWSSPLHSTTGTLSLVAF